MSEQKDDVHTFFVLLASTRAQGRLMRGNFKLKLNWPLPIEAAGILLNERPRRARLVRCVLVSSPLACVVPERERMMFCGGLFLFVFFGCDW